MRISLIVAMSENRVIGRKGQLPWRLRTDLRRFKQLTMGHTLIVGRRTWESIGRALPGRQMIVVTRRQDYAVPAGVERAHSLAAALALALGRGETEAFIGGGAELYREALPGADRLYLTKVHATVAGDTYLPEFDESLWRREELERHAASEADDHPFSVWLYERGQ